MSDSPYKFLDAYDRDDRDLFFGREREVQVLLSDIVLSRLVVLFAKTGTGKTSLIHAGVRPALEDRGYETFYVRVARGDPTDLARAELRSHERIGSLRRGDFAAQLAGVAGDLSQPIVVFFDQFEEFFLYLMRDNEPLAREFIAQIAAIYRTRASGVHVVLSMREDFYVEMDAFRDEIPTIFENDSSVRLRWFDAAQARAAIVRPAEVRGVVVEPDLVDSIVRDLARGSQFIEPAELQIVCDTMWEQREGGRITLARYGALGSDQRSGTVAEQILTDRLAQRFEVFESREDFAVLAELLSPGTLTTERGTKYVRDVDSLNRELAGAFDYRPSTVAEVLKGLVGARLARLFTRDELVYVELTHDYLAAEPERLAELRARVRTIWPRRVLDAGRDSWDAGRGAFMQPTDDLEEVLTRVRSERQDGTPERDRLPLTADDAVILLQLALHRALHAVDVFELAMEHDAPAMAIVSERIRNGDVGDAANAVELLAELGTPAAVDVLRNATKRIDIAPAAIAGLELSGSEEAVEVLVNALDNDRLAVDAQRALTAIASRTDDHAAATAATRALIAYLENALHDPELRPLALEDLGRIEAEEAVAALALLAREPPTASGARRALRRLTRSRKEAVAYPARTALDETAGGPPDAPPSTGPLLGPDDAREAPALSRVLPPRQVNDSLLERHLSVAARAILDGRAVPFVGAGANASGRPAGEGWRRGGTLPTGSELAGYLADRSRYPAGEAKDLLQVSQYVGVMLGERVLYEYLRDVFAADYAVGPVQALLAGLPRLARESDRSEMLMLTTNYDDALERALQQQEERFDVLVYVAAGPSSGKWLHRTPDGENRVIERPNEYTGLASGTVVVKVQGSVDRDDPEGDSFVVTEDDFIEYLVRGRSPLPPVVQAKLMRSHLLFLGQSIRDWNQRLLVNSLLQLRTRLRYRSWAVNQPTGPTERGYWERMDVEVIDVPLDEYVERLASYLRQVAPRITE